MRRTHLSLYYLATYLPLAGLALLLVPDFATKLFLSNRSYDEYFMRLSGGVLLALGVLIIQIVRHRVVALYTTTLVVRVGLCLVLASLFVLSGDPFFVVIFGVVAIGVALTGWSVYMDRKSARS